VTLMKRVADKLDLMSWAPFRDEVMETGAENDRLVAEVDYRRATPEAALLHWL
jgi:hypothetical protein